MKTSFYRMNYQKEKEKGVSRIFRYGSYFFISALILFLVLLFVFRDGKNISGNVVLQNDDEKPQNDEVFTDEKTDEVLNFAPLANPIFDLNNSNFTNSSQRRSSGGGSGGNGGSQGNSNGNQNQSSNQSENNGNQNNNSNNGNQNNSGQGGIRNLKTGLKLKVNGREVNSNDIFRGLNRFNLEKGQFRIADFDIDFEEDVDLSDVNADFDFGSGKSFMHHSKGLLKNIVLYIPRVEGMNGVVICSNASSFDEVYLGCGNESHVTKEYVLTLGDENISLSDDGLFFIVSGITGTGGNGVNVTAGPPQTAPADPAGNVSAFAGNVTYLSVNGFSVTQSWQGYFGNVSGTIQLGDAAGNVLYNWSLAEPGGQVYASTNSTINWPTIQCFNFTANGTGGVSGETPGATNLQGVNLSVLEASFGILSDDIDGVDETFSFAPGGDGHDLFYASSLEFDTGECLSAKTYNSAGTQGASEFEEALLFEPTTSSVLFASIIEEGTLNGFNNEDNDFQMLVLENGHGIDVATTTYYFFAEMH